MGGSHGHSHGGLPADVHDVPVRTRSRAVLLGTLALFGVATLVGLVVLGPTRSRLPRSEPGSTTPPRG